MRTGEQGRSRAAPAAATTPAIVRNWRTGHLTPGVANVILATDSFGEPAFCDWLEAQLGHLRASAGLLQSSVFLAVSPAADLDALRVLLQSVRAGVELVSVPDDHPEDVDLRSIVTSLLAGSSLTDEDNENDDELRTPAAPNSTRALAAYLNPPHRLSDDAYASWLERLRRHPDDRGD